MPASMFEGGGISRPNPPARRGGGGRFGGKSTTKTPTRGGPARRSGGGSFGGGRKSGGGYFSRQFDDSRRPGRPGNNTQRRSGQLSGGSRGSGYGPAGGGGGYQGGGFGSSSTGGYSTMAAAPSVNDYLGGDDTYQAQVAAINKALSNYKTQMGERTDEYNTEYTNRLKELNTSEQRATTEQTDDYAGRGMYISGLYGKARGDLEQDYNRREGDMNTAKSAFLNGLQRDLLNYTEEQNLTKDKARMDAINRRAAQYGIIG